MFLKQLSSDRSRPLKQYGVEMWMSECLLLPSEVSFSLNTHTRDIQVGLQHLWRYLTWHKGAGRKMSFNFMDRENGAFCRGEEQAKQIGFILR